MICGNFIFVKGIEGVVFNFFGDSSDCWSWIWDMVFFGEFRCLI